MAKIQRFGTIARRQQAAFRLTLSPQAQSPNDDKARRNPHLVAHGCEVENLFPGIRGADGALRFFRERGVKWWTNARSGDRKVGADYAGPTRNLASSQVSCVNFLLPLAEIPGALTAFLRCIDDDVVEVEPIVDQSGRSALVEFEWVGWDRPLEGGGITRGANQTSIDALLVARVPEGRRAYLVEWKYCEEYLRPDDKGLGDSGATRRRRYSALYAAPDSSFNQVAPLDEFLFEPFYQIMRMHLLRDRMLVEGVSPDMPVTEARVVVVCPTANQDYRRAVRTTPLSRRFPQMHTVEDVVRATLRDPDVFGTVGQETVVSELRASPLAPQLKDWLAYHRSRYGW